MWLSQPWTALQAWRVGMEKLQVAVAVAAVVVVAVAVWMGSDMSL